MPRSEPEYIAEATKQAVHPIILVRVLDMPNVNDPTITDSLYLTDHNASLTFFDERDQLVTYYASGLSVDYAEVGNDNKVSECRVKIDNVDSAFSSLAQTKRLNGVTVEVLRVFLDNMSTPDAAQMMFGGKIKAIVISETYIDATVTAGLGLSAQTPRRMYWPQLFPYLPSAKDIRDPYYAER